MAVDQHELRAVVAAGSREPALAHGVSAAGTVDQRRHLRVPALQLPTAFAACSTNARAAVSSLAASASSISKAYE